MYKTRSCNNEFLFAQPKTTMKTTESSNIRQPRLFNTFTNHVKNYFGGRFQTLKHATLTVLDMATPHVR